MKVRSSQEFHRSFLSVEFFRGTYLAHFRLLRSSSIFSKCGILEKSTLRLFSTFENSSEVYTSFIFDFWEFMRSIHFVYFWLLRILQRSTLRLFSTFENSWEVYTSFIFDFWEFLRSLHFVYFRLLRILEKSTLRLFSTFENS